MKTSRTASVGISVVTKRLCHLFVTNSRISSGLVKTWAGAEGRRAKDVSESDSVKPLLVVRAEDDRAPLKAL